MKKTFTNKLIFFLFSLLMNLLKILNNLLLYPIIIIVLQFDQHLKYINN